MIATTARPNQHGPDDEPVRLRDLLPELGRRLSYVLLTFVGVFAICLYYSNPIFGFLIAEPWLLGIYIVLDYLDSPVVMARLSAFVALIVCFPLIVIQLCAFSARGLYRREKREFWLFMGATSFMFYLGVVLMYYFVMPNVIFFRLQ